MSLFNSILSFLLLNKFVADKNKNQVNEQLIIYFSEQCSVSGVAGSDPRDRSFKTVTQGEKYDPDGSYTAAWVPEVAALAAPLRHRPWDVESGSEKDLLLRESYPDPIIDPTSQIGKGPRRT